MPKDCPLLSITAGFVSPDYAKLCCWCLDGQSHWALKHSQQWLRNNTRNREETIHVGVWSFLKIIWVKAPYLLSVTTCEDGVVCVCGPAGEAQQCWCGFAAGETVGRAIQCICLEDRTSSCCMAVSHRDGKWSRKRRQNLHLWKMLWNL